MADYNTYMESKMNTENKTQKQTRSAVLDIAKGIGILTVVWAHAKGPYSNYIYQFHMPFFFLISGYLFNMKDSFFVFLKKKTFTLYIPFIFWNILSELLKWTFHLYPYTLRSFLDQTVKILLTLSKDGQFYGATWFIGSLFVVSVFYKYLYENIGSWKYKSLSLLAVFTLLMVTGFQITLPYMISRTLVLSFFYALGETVKEYKEELSHLDTPAFGVVCLLWFLVIAEHNSANMGKNEYRYCAVFVIGAVCASYALLWCARLIERFFRRLGMLLQYLGKKSIDIVLWQFIAFRIVIAGQLLLAHEPLGTLLDYYPVYSVESGWWIVYFVVGVAAPILFGILLRVGFWGSALKKLHIVT